MVGRRPLVVVGGNTRELPAGDVVPLNQLGLRAVSVLEYGAVGDGVADDTAAIQAAIDAAPVGAVVWFPAGTYLVSATIRLAASRSYLGPGGRSQLAILKATAGITGGAVAAAAGWYSSASTCDNPITVEGLLFDASSVTGVHGLVVYNFWSTFRDLQFRNVAGAAARGLLATDRGRNGSTVTTNSHSENVYENLRFYDHTASASAFWAESNNGYSNQDGHLRNSFFAGIGGYGIRLGRAAGWSVVDNHLYGIGFDGINATSCYATKIQSNYIEDFGGQNAANPGDPTYGYYNGIALGSILDDRASIVSGNTVSTVTPATLNGQRWTCYYVRAGSGQNRAHVVVTGNTAIVIGAPTRSHAFWLGEGGDSGRLLAVEWSTNQIQNVSWASRRNVAGGATVAVTEPSATPIPATEVNDLLAWTLDPAGTVGTTPTVTAGTVYLTRVVLPAPGVVTGAWFYNAASGSGNTLGYVGLYDMAGNRLAQTANITTAWQSVGDKQCPFTAPITLPAGDYYLAFVANGSTTVPKPIAASSQRVNFAIATAARARSATGPASQTALPATITMSSLVANTVPMLFGLY